ncbi:MAG: hypothetical protein ACRCSF_04115 [Mycobacteriaceae bacterium]
MTVTSVPEFRVDDISTGPYAHGFGQTKQGQTFAFQVREGVLHVEMYRANFATAMPEPDDIIFVSERPVVDIDLTDEHSIIAAVQEAVSDSSSASVPIFRVAVQGFFRRVSSLFS